MATDQEIRDAGYKYIPQQKWLLNPFEIPTTDDGDGGSGGGGIPNTNAADGFSVYNPDPNSIVNKNYDPYRYRNLMEDSFLYGGSNATVPKYLNQSFDPSGQIKDAQFMYNKALGDIDAKGLNARTQTFTQTRPSQEVMDYYGEKILDNQERYRTQGQYETVPSEFAYSSQTELDKFKDMYPEYFAPKPLEGIPGALQKYAQNSFLGKGLGVAKNFLNDLLPTNRRAIMENELGGQGIMVNNIGQIVAANQGSAYDPSGSNIMAGYNANKVTQETFDKRRAKAKEKMSPEGFKKFNTALTAAEEKFFGAKDKADFIFDEEDKKKKKIDVLNFLKKKKAADPAGTTTDTTDTTTDTTDTTTGGGSYDAPGGVTSSNYDQAANIAGGGGGDTATYGGQTAREATYDNDPSTGTSQGYSQHYARGGRVYFFDGGRVAVMNGGLISLL